MDKHLGVKRALINATTLAQPRVRNLQALTLLTLALIKHGRARARAHRTHGVACPLLWDGPGNAKLAGQGNGTGTEESGRGRPKKGGSVELPTPRRRSRWTTSSAATRRGQVSAPYCRLAPEKWIKDSPHNLLGRPMLWRLHCPMPGPLKLRMVDTPATKRHRNHHFGQRERHRRDDHGGHAAPTQHRDPDLRRRSLCFNGTDVVNWCFLSVQNLDQANTALCLTGRQCSCVKQKHRSTCWIPDSPAHCRLTWAPPCDWSKPRDVRSSSEGPSKRSPFSCPGDIDRLAGLATSNRPSTYTPCVLLGDVSVLSQGALPMGPATQAVGVGFPLRDLLPHRIIQDHLAQARALRPPRPPCMQPRCAGTGAPSHPSRRQLAPATWWRGRGPKRRNCRVPTSPCGRLCRPRRVWHRPSLGGASDRRHQAQASRSALRDLQPS